MKVTYGTNADDIGLVKATKKFVFNNFVGPATIVNKMEMQSLMPEKSVMKVYGWGSDKCGLNNDEPTLRYGQASLHKRLEHNAKNNQEFNIPLSNDSGGPVLLEDVAVTSVGKDTEVCEETRGG